MGRAPEYPCPVRAPTPLGVLVSTLLGVTASCSFPDPTFVDAAGGGSAGSSTAGASAACPADCEPELVAQDQGEVIAIAVNGSRVYWISTLEAENSAELRSADLGETGVDVVTSEGLGSSAEVLAVDDGSAFIANRSSGGELVSVRLSDGFLAWRYMQERIDTILLDGSTLYYSSPYAVVLLPIVGPDTGGRRDLADSGGPRLLMQDGDYLILLDQSEDRLPPRRVVRLRSDGSEPLAEAAVLLDDAPDFDSACADENAYYFADPDGGEIVRLVRADVMAVEPLAQGEATPRALQLQSGALYWTTEPGAQLRRLALGDDAPVTVGEAVPSVVATSSSSGVFWATPAGEILGFGQ